MWAYASKCPHYKEFALEIVCKGKKLLTQCFCRMKCQFQMVTGTYVKLGKRVNEIYIKNPPNKKGTLVPGNGFGEL